MLPPENLQSSQSQINHFNRQYVRPLRAQVGSLKLPKGGSGFRTIEFVRRLLRERNLPPKAQVVDPRSLDQGEIQFQVHTHLPQSPRRLLRGEQVGRQSQTLPSNQQRITINDNGNSVVGTSSMSPPSVIPRPLRQGVQVPLKLTNLLKRKAQEERENQRSVKMIKISSPTPTPPQQEPPVTTRRELRPRR